MDLTTITAIDRAFDRLLEAAADLGQRAPCSFLT